MTTTEVPAAQVDAPRSYSHRQIQVIMSGLMMGMLLAALDQTIVTTALTRISEDLKRPDLYSWVVTSYLLTSTATLPLYGKVSDLFGRKRVFQFAIVVFLIGSAMSGLSQSMYQLIVFRGIQGIGAGGLISTAMAIVGDVIPPRQRGRYQGYFGAVFGVSSVLGPLIGGLLVDEASWRWVFYVNLPIGALALVVVNRTLKSDFVKIKASIDWLGALLLVTGVAMILAAVQNIGNEARFDGASQLLAVAGSLIVVAFVWWEFRAAEPVLPMRLFRNGVFRVTAILSLVTGGVMFGAIIFLPQYMQLARGVSPTISGLRLVPLMVGLLITSIGSGRLISKYGRYKIYVVSGTALLAAGLGLLTLITVTMNLYVLDAMLVVVGAGLGLFMQTLVIAAQNSVERHDLGVVTSGVTFARTLGGAIGASVLGASVVEYERTHRVADIAKYGVHAGPLHAFTSGMDRAFLFALPLALLSFVISFFLREAKLGTGEEPVVGSS